MPQQVLESVENNFTKGFVTEFTGLNFPENAATDSDNTEYTLVGDVVRREGIDFETNFAINKLVDRSGNAISDYKWNNAGGDGFTQVVVEQIGQTIYFFKSSDATGTSPLSTRILASTVSLLPALGATFNSSIECQYADGNGYLFIFHPNCEPIYCTYNAGVVTANPITISIRDFSGLPEPGSSTNVRNTPNNTSIVHVYNLLNQGWTKGSPWQATSSTSLVATTGVLAFTVAAGLTVTTGDVVNITNLTDAFPGGVFQPAGSLIMSGVVNAYAGTTLTLNITAVSSYWSGTTYNSWNIFPISTGLINTFIAASGVYPSNADVWWSFKNASGVFDPATTINNITLSSGRAPQGHFVMQAFNQQRSLLSGQVNLNDIVTSARPTNGAWFQGRIWYTGTTAQQPAVGNAPYYSWSENIYFSQIVKGTQDFGSCYQVNDPTSETLFNLLPTDGGVIQIQGSGPVYKLFPLQNAMLIFAANGVWYLTGNQGIGFSATDYTIVKLSSVRSISSTSFVDVLGLPLFWNEEGIYKVEPAKQGTQLLNSPLHVNPLEVNPITVGTILSFYNSIPLQSKKFVKGAYHPIDYVVQWVYKSTPTSTITERYHYDKILNYNTVNKAFFPYTIGGIPYVHNVRYVDSPGGTDAPSPAFKYFSSYSTPGTINYTFADEHDVSFVDWKSLDQIGTNYVSTFTTGYKVHGKGEHLFQIPYVFVFSRLPQSSGYYIQSIWDYATSQDSGRWSVKEIANINSPNFGMIRKRHSLRGQGFVLQIKYTSIDGLPFDIMGWALYETVNTGV